MFHLHGTVRNALGNMAVKGLRGMRFKRFSAFMLCAALTANAVPMDVFAAQDTTFISEETSLDTENLCPATTNGEILSNAKDTSAEDSDAGIIQESDAPSDENTGMEISLPNGDLSNEHFATNASPENSNPSDGNAGTDASQDSSNSSDGNSST